MPIRTFSCPQCKLVQTKETGPPLGPYEIKCSNCGNLLRVYDHGGGSFTFEVWTGRTERSGAKVWTLAALGGQQKSRVL